TAWDRLPGSKRRHVTFEIIESSGEAHRYYLGIHVPKLKQEDLSLIHRLWISVVGKNGDDSIHHRDIVVAALHLLEKELRGTKRNEVIKQIKDVEPKKTKASNKNKKPAKNG